MAARKIVAVAVSVFASSLLGGCAQPADEASASTENAVEAEDQDVAAPVPPEAVQLLNDNGTDYCTGVLIRDRLVLTAAHCAWGTFTVRAPFAEGAPSRKATVAKKLTVKVDDPAVRDVAILELDQPITLPEYGVPTDIGAQADEGETFQGVAVGRKEAARSGALVRSKTMSVATAKDEGYTTGLKSSWYSSPGDSGGPLFLVENGKLTHKVVGVERQPDPSQDADYFTRLDSVVADAIDAVR